MKRAFTIIELLVAIGLLAALLAGSGAVFHTAVKAQRTASATAEISRKLAAIRTQLNADFRGLRKDGEIFVVWVPGAVDDDGTVGVDWYERFDRILFFTDGDFQSYRPQPTLDPDNPKVVHGNVARVCYMLANYFDGTQVRDASDLSQYSTNQREAQWDQRRQRILSRTQHILTSDIDIIDQPVLIPSPVVDADFRNHNFNYEFDKMFAGGYMNLQGWKDMPWLDKAKMLTIATKIIVGPGSTLLPGQLGATVNPADPATIHMLFCQGVGEFIVQGWSDVLQRWVPELDPDGDGDLASDSDFFPDPGGDPTKVDVVNIPGVLYPDGTSIISGPLAGYPAGSINEANFNSIPGLGRAFKFTFTLYDSRGVFKKGKTFTHIVHLDG